MTEDICKLPSKSEVIEIMSARHYDLVHESRDGIILSFANLTNNNIATRLNVTFFLDKNMYALSTIIHPGIVKLTTDFFTDIKDDTLFDSLEKSLTKILEKVYYNE